MPDGLDTLENYTAGGTKRVILEHKREMKQYQTTCEENQSSSTLIEDFRMRYTGKFGIFLSLIQLTKLLLSIQFLNPLAPNSPG